ncbi:hypothetical protein R1sor_018951 [Riccia sorocarpa]|uniref:FHA domain-containing protein n=1 Tax=Riccia sorocarpa TaxID=122646 RepID=A0ABD3ICW3_9MARC
MKGGGNMVPMLTVLKGDEVVDTISLEGRDTMIMGRHHSCDLVVGHASSSRRHLEIQIVHATRDVILTDLGSVHGTWVNGTRLSFMTPVVFNGGVTFQLAASSRVYSLEWRPVATDEDSEPEVSTDSFVVPSEPLPKDLPSQTPSRSNSGLRQSSENQDFSSRKSTSKRGVSGEKGGEKVHLPSSAQHLQQDENLSPAVLNSPGRKLGQLQRSATALAGSPKQPMRRLAFSSLQSSSNSKQPLRSSTPRSGASPSVKKGLTERLPTQQSVPTKVTALDNKVFSSPSKLQQAGTTQNNKTPSKLWLRRGSSAPLPALSTHNGAENIPSSNSHQRSKIIPSAPPLSELTEEEPTAAGVALSTRSISDKTKRNNSKNYDDEQEYPSDKENMDPVRIPFKSVSAAFKSSNECSASSVISKGSSSSLVESIERQPFRPLFNPLPCTTVGYKGVFQSTADSYGSSEEDFNYKALSVRRPHQKNCPTAENLDQLLRRLKLADSIEGRKQWHAVIDTNCLLDAESLKALRQLEGIKEVSVIIPKIVVRELDFLKHRDGLRSSAREALRWIESCMVKLPNWIRVQRSSETLPVGATPPPSPSMSAFPHRGDLMSPTNDDHILECAMLFEMSMHYGKVALLTRDTALRIKAMSEGLLSESAVEFVESLLSPYSNRFLWSGSTAHGKTWVDSPRPSPMYPGEATAARLKSHSHVNHPVQELRNHISAQPRGLQVVVSR